VDQFIAGTARIARPKWRILMIVFASANHTLDALLERICVNLQLTKTQDGRARAHYDAVTKWLAREDSPLRAYAPHIFPQGSQRLGTANKPVGKAEFDLDAVCKVILDTPCSPGALYALIWNRLAENETYRPMMRRMPRCIRLEYTGDFHLDIAPAVPDTAYGGNYILVPDLDSDLSLHHPLNNAWKATNPVDYALWFEDCCVPVSLTENKYAKAQIDPVPHPEPIHTKPSLKRSVQLFKRWRDIEYKDRPNLAPPSIILTTLSAYHYEQHQLCTDALSSILESLVLRIERGEQIRLTNPAHDEEQLCEKWDRVPGAYGDFCEAVTSFQDRWQHLQSLRGLAAIEMELTDLFGESPVQSAIRELAEREVIQPRADRTLRVQPKTGLLIPAAAVARSVALPSNTFHGDSNR
jgi:hypothetical protein